MRVDWDRLVGRTLQAMHLLWLRVWPLFSWTGRYAHSQKLDLVDANAIGNYIRLHFSQLDEVRRLLDSQSIGYWVDENAISFDGGPEMIKINFYRGTYVTALQELLDSNG